MKNWNKNINVPNALSVLRILLIAPFVLLFMRGDVVPAVVCLAVSGLSDLFDGMIARRFNQFTELGQMLDPLADKLTQATVAVCLAVKQPILIPLLAVFVVKEFAMLCAACFLVLKKKKRPSGSKWYGKVATFLFYISFIAITIMESVHYDNLAMEIVLLSITAAFMIYALVQYGRIFISILHSNDPKDEIDLKADMKEKRS